MTDTGLHVPAWAGRRKVEATAWVRAEGRRTNAPCCLCRQPIDYDLPPEHPESCTVQHVRSRKTHPHLTWARSNWAPAHASCNKAAGTGESAPLGLTSGW